MTKEDYVSLEVAKKLQEKGYDEPCLAYYFHGELIQVTSQFRGSDVNMIYQESRSQMYGNVPAPTLYDVQKWLRKKHTIFVVVVPHYSRKYEIIEYEYRIATYFDLLEKQGKRIKSKEYYELFEQCLNNAILEALNYI